MNSSDYFYIPDPENTLPEGEPGWIEIRCTFPVHTFPIVPWAQLRAAAENWRMSGLMDRFFFVRKPPGMRLRVHAATSPAALLELVSQWLCPIEKERLVIRSVRGIYEPEVRRFGGDQGMSIAHALWTADTDLVLEYESLAQAAGCSVPRTILWSVLVNNLLRATLDDAAEAWDVWDRLNEAFAILPCDPAMSATFQSVVRALDGWEGEWEELLSPLLAGSLNKAITQTQRAATDLRALLLKGELGVGIRSWLTANALFQSNRWGLGLEPSELRALVSAMRQLLEPDAR